MTELALERPEVVPAGWIEKRLALEPSQERMCAVAPVDEGTPRPQWSVMIPTYNCAAYLRQTLASVLAQDPGPARMQIEVIDDCSTKDDPEAVVREMGAGRVGFFRQPANGGAIHNFNTCIRRSVGHLVHILHGDDLVEPGFYQKMEALTQRFPDVALYAARARHINEDGIEGRAAFGWSVFSRPSPFLAQFARPTREPGSFFYLNPLRTPAIVVRRSFYEQHGGFIEAFVHAADWEMWLRAICEGRGVMLNELLTRYRVFAGSDTSKLARSAENLRDPIRMASILRRRHPHFNFKLFQLLMWLRASLQARKFRKSGDAEAARANQRLREDLQPLGLSLRALSNLTATSVSLFAQTTSAMALAAVAPLSRARQP